MPSAGAPALGTYTLDPERTTIRADEVRLSDAREESGGARFRATARLDRTTFGVTKKKGMVGRTVDLVIEAVAQSA